MTDVRYGVRRLLASPGFTLAALATMALGIGANSAIFTIVNTVMLKPAAVERPDRLVEVYTNDTDGTLSRRLTRTTWTSPRYPCSPGRRHMS